MLKKVREIDEVRVLGHTKNENSTGVMSFLINGVHPHDIASILDGENVCVRAGHHCAKPLIQKLNVEATTRASLSIYNDESDIDKLVKGLKKVITIFK